MICTEPLDTWDNPKKYITLTHWKKVAEISTANIDTIDFDVREYETLPGDKPNSPIWTKIKTIRSFLYGNFEIA